VAGVTRSDASESSESPAASLPSGAGLEPLVEVPQPEPQSEQRQGLRPRAEDLTERMRGLLALVQERGRITTQEHMASSGTSHRTALRDLQTLANNGFIERVGSRRGAYYRPSPVGKDLVDR